MAEYLPIHIGIFLHQNPLPAQILEYFLGFTFRHGIDDKRERVAVDTIVRAFLSDNTIVPLEQVELANTVLLQEVERDERQPMAQRPVALLEHGLGQRHKIARLLLHTDKLFRVETHGK